MESETFKRQKMVALLFVWITMGLYTVMGGVAMVDLKLLFNTSYKDISGALSGYPVGHVPGSIFAGVVVDMKKFACQKEGFLAISQLLVALFIALTPAALNTGVMTLLMALMGFFVSCVKIAVTKIVLEMYGETAATAMFLSAMGFAIGALLSPIILNPFLAVTTQRQDVVQRHTQNVDDDHEVPGLGEATHVQTGLFVIACITALVALPLLYYQHKRNQDLKASALKIESSESSFQPKLTRESDSSLTMLGMLCLFLFSVVGGECVFGNFVRTFSVDQLKFTRDQASYLNGMFWLTFSLGRLFASIISRCVSVRRVLIVYALIHLVTTTIGGQYSPEKPSSMWIFTAAQGMATAPLYPSGVAYVNTKMEISGRGLMYLEIAGAAAAALTLALTGWMFDTYGPNSILYVLQLAGISVLFSGSILLCVGHNNSPS